MNYYRRWIGDYIKKTAHLSLAEHGAYGVLLDIYYSTEKPLPASADALCRLCRAMNSTEQAAVRSIADQFFPIGEDGLRHNLRADEELGIAQATIQKQKKSGAESAAKRWSTDESTHKLTDKLTDGSTYKSTDAEAMQPPTSNLQPSSANLQPSTSIPQPRSKAEARATRLPSDWKLPDAWRDWAMRERPELSAGRVDAIAAVFVDHWRSLPTSKAVKSDWQATWRNWVRREKSIGKSTVADANAQAAQQWADGGRTLDAH